MNYLVLFIIIVDADYRRKRERGQCLLKFIDRCGVPSAINTT